MTDSRVRLVGVRIQIEAVTDDGEVLTPVPIEPFLITAADWPKFDVDNVLLEIGARLNGQSPE